MEKKMHFRFCANCGGLLDLEECCDICKNLSNYDPIQSQTDLKSLFYPSTKTEVVDSNGKTHTTLEHGLDYTKGITDKKIPHFLKIEEGEPYIWFPCRECKGKFREITVVILGKNEPSTLYGVCGHFFEEKLPLELVEDIESNFDKQ